MSSIEPTNALSANDAKGIETALPSTGTAFTPSFSPRPPAQQPPDSWAWAYLLYDTNGGCALPCWWGITPGTTTWEEVEQIFTPHEPDVVIERGQPNSARQGNSEIYIVYYPSRNNSVDYSVSTLFRVEGDTVVSLSLDPEASMWGGFGAGTILDSYGLPDRVYIANGELALYYDVGFVVSYRIERDQTQSCIVAFGRLIAWSHGIETSDEFIRQELLDMDLTRLGGEAAQSVNGQLASGGEQECFSLDTRGMILPDMATKTKAG